MRVKNGFFTSEVARATGLTPREVACAETVGIVKAQPRRVGVGGERGARGANRVFDFRAVAILKIVGVLKRDFNFHMRVICHVVEGLEAHGLDLQAATERDLLVVERTTQVAFLDREHGVFLLTGGRLTARQAMFRIVLSDQVESLKYALLKAVRARRRLDTAAMERFELPTIELYDEVAPATREVAAN